MSDGIVSVLGAGNGGKAMAADLSLRGHPVRLYDRYPSAVADVQERGTIYLHGSERSGSAEVQLATSDLSAAVTGADVLVIVVPAVAHEYLIEQLLPLLADGQTVLFTRVPGERSPAPSLATSSPPAKSAGRRDRQPALRLPADRPCRGRAPGHQACA